jgi:hypothetical protein
MVVAREREYVEEFLVLYRSAETLNGNISVTCWLASIDNREHHEGVMSRGKEGDSMKE